jgi:hypothetical protein
VLGTLYGQAIVDIPSGLSYGAKAKDAINRAVEKAPKSSAVYVARGVGNFYLPAMLGGGPKPAIDDFKKAIELDPEQRGGLFVAGRQPAQGQSRRRSAQSLRKIAGARSPILEVNLTQRCRPSWTVWLSTPGDPHRFGIRSIWSQAWTGKFQVSGRVQDLVAPKSWTAGLSPRAILAEIFSDFCAASSEKTKSEQSTLPRHSSSRPALVEQLPDRHAAHGQTWTDHDVYQRLQGGARPAK